MKNIIQKVQTLKYGYVPGEFLPIYSGGELENRKEFVAYKLRCVLHGKLQ